MLRPLDAKLFEVCFGTCICHLAGVVAGVVATDGQTAGSSKESHNTALRAISAFAITSGSCLAQQQTLGKGIKIVAIKALLDTLLLKGCIATLDANGCRSVVIKPSARTMGASKPGRRCELPTCP